MHLEYDTTVSQHKFCNPATRRRCVWLIGSDRLRNLVLLGGIDVGSAVIIDLCISRKLLIVWQPMIGRQVKKILRLNFVNKATRHSCGPDSKISVRSLDCQAIGLLINETGHQDSSYTRANIHIRLKILSNKNSK